MNFSDLVVPGPAFEADLNFINQQTDCNRPVKGMLDSQYNSVREAIKEFYASLAAYPIEAVVPSISLSTVDNHVLYHKAKIPVFNTDIRLISTPKSQWVKTGLGLGPNERAYNDGIARFESICKNHGLSLVGHNTATAGPFGYEYYYVVN